MQEGNHVNHGTLSDPQTGAFRWSYSSEEAQEVRIRVDFKKQKESAVRGKYTPVLGDM